MPAVLYERRSRTGLAATPPPDCAAKGLQVLSSYGFFDGLAPAPPDGLIEAV